MIVKSVFYVCRVLPNSAFNTATNNLSPFLWLKSSHVDLSLSMK